MRGARVYTNSAGWEVHVLGRGPGWKTFVSLMASLPLGLPISWWLGTAGTLVFCGVWVVVALVAGYVTAPKPPRTYTAAEVAQITADAEDRLHEAHVRVWRRQMANLGIPTVELTFEDAPVGDPVVTVEEIR